MSSLIPYSRQSVDEDDIKEVLAVLRSDYLTQGPKSGEFEAALANYCGAEFAVVFSSGTAALHGAYFAAGIGPGDEIITSPITFAATANAALYLGAKPVFSDIEPETGNIDPELIEKAITSGTKAIVPVDYAGNPAALNRIRELAGKHGLIVIEDACHALGASYKENKIGSLSEMTIFSFHPVKPITTGEGGAVVTNNRSFYEKLLAFRSHGIVKDAAIFKEHSHGNWYYEMQVLGYNYRLTDIQCALGLSQLKKLDTFIQRRQEIALSYNAAFHGNRWFDTPVVTESAQSSWHLYPIRLRDGSSGMKTEIFDKLRTAGLWVQVHYLPVYLHPYYRNILGYREGICPQAERFYERELSIPIYQGMSDADIETVKRTLFDVLGEF
ncbi:MAG: UDP-4-amino-4,6-dideoxy-N-acetyl-beta-L-altrosamine transaminase [Nitrospiraceae bacterium]|nr:UDP-4-amino-4,6-dideoxy-N-acetyl-beta-L-altrosamine transaminase [Nitrospiraceae bacterium]